MSLRLSEEQFEELLTYLDYIQLQVSETLEFVRMDRKINQIQETTKKLAKQETQLLTADKKRDKVCAAGKKKK